MLPALLQNRPTTQQLPAAPTLGYRALADFVGIIAATGFDATQWGGFVFPPVAPTTLLAHQKTVEVPISAG